ncbi:uncharacterized mitochondrial protein AtMg00810-like [Amaranthus tricolor]|uniref:uncharacterized mitochondrial protein AtMg00810-like n=1 Tax=Amaranthus tricolor TaxID=29722 RepID=UPI0025864D6A|nr:uncharacterized mitochondrial protein AtMg00810-like [Amaranthus tricolor]
MVCQIDTRITSSGFTQSKNDYSLFVHRITDSITIVAIYVDDIILTCYNPLIIHQLKAHLHHIFSIKDLGTLSFFLGIEVSYVDQGIIIMSQKKFTLKLIRDSGIQVNKRAVTPLPVHLKLQHSYSPLFSDPTLYRSLALTHTLSYVANTAGQGILLNGSDQLHL